jgi:hypothetical protein
MDGSRQSKEATLSPVLRNESVKATRGKRAGGVLYRYNDTFVDAAGRLLPISQTCSSHRVIIYSIVTLRKLLLFLCYPLMVEDHGGCLYMSCRPGARQKLIMAFLEFF